MQSHALQLAQHARRLQARAFAVAARRRADADFELAIAATNALLSRYQSVDCLPESNPEEDRMLAVAAAADDAIDKLALAAESMALAENAEALAAVAADPAPAQTADPDSKPTALILKWPPTLPLGRLSPCNTPRVAVAA